MSTSAYSLVTRERAPRPCVFAVYLDGRPVHWAGRPVEHATLRSASDRADELATGWGIDRARFDLRRVSL